MFKRQKIKDDVLAEIENDNAWDERKLGSDVKHAVLHQTSADNSLNLKLISCRLQQDLIDDLKYIASSKGINYQPLIRQVLTEYVSMHHRNHLNGH
ncbi:CopG family antitoxin [Caedibacter taeniospiralis]|jgi:predicted DNA binding CopG/RHH family protein|uniref:CopG family antitoxin n=1 Tax=Caedibacter taeniospiralis TaxID=28907 RepID=UPI0037C06D11